MRTTYKVDPRGDFKRAIDQALTQVKDLTVPLKAVADDFYRSQPGLFRKTGAGGYEDLSPSYKLQKAAEVGFVYPVLRKSGALERSTTKGSDPNAIFRILGKSAVEIGSRLPYAKFVQAKRPFVFIGPEVPSIATAEQRKRLPRWIGIVKQYVIDVTKRELG